MNSQYTRSGIIATLTVGASTYKSKIYEIYHFKPYPPPAPRRLYSFLTKTTSSHNYPNPITIDSPVTITVPLPANYDVTKKGYIFMQSGSDDYIEFNDKSAITAPAGKYFTGEYLGILPDSVSGSSIDITLSNVAPEIKKTSRFYSYEGINIEIYTDECMVAYYTYDTLPDGDRWPTVNTKSFDSKEMSYAFNPGENITVNRDYKVTFKTTVAIKASYELYVDLGLNFHDAKFSQNPQCYISQKDLQLGACSASLVDGNKYQAKVVAIGDVPKDTTITFNLNLISASSASGDVTVYSSFGIGNVEEATISDKTVIAICPSDQYATADNRCVNDCTTIDGYYGGSTTPKKCLRCVDFCTDCSNGTSCDVCNATYKRKADSNGNYLCTQDCGDGYYVSTTTPLTCIACDDKCETCTQAGSCTKCKDGKYLHDNGTQCLDSCLAGFYPQSNPNRCVNCINKCASCTSATCSLCETNYYLYQNGSQCILGCNSADKRFITTDANPTCQDCMAGCDNCSNSSTCDACTSPKVLKADRSACQVSCDGGYYADSNRVCRMCMNFCAVCSNSSSCTTCNSGYLLFGGGTSCQPRANCQTTNGYFIENNTSCKKCIDDCSICSNGVACDQCISSHSLNENRTKCLSECPEGYYTDSTGIKICVKCLDGCHTCDNNATCIECDSGKSLHNNGASCLTTCPAGYYKGTVSDKSTCIACSDALTNCSECTSATACTLCQSDYFLLQDTKRCVQTCPAEYTTITSPIKSCRLCIDNCAICASATECAVCAQGYTYLTGPPLCFKNCDDGYYRDDRTCRKCREECATCENGNQCITCKASFYSYETQTEKKCLKECPAFYYEDTASSSCKLCQENCEDCSDASSCKKCKAGYYINYQGSCQNCPSMCKECTVIDAKVLCTMCADGYFMYEDECSRECPEGLYEVAATNTCEICPSGTYSNEDLCSACPTLCKECESDSVCTYCIQNAVLNKSQKCECGERYIQNENVCERKVVSYEVTYSDMTRLINIELSAPLVTPLAKENIQVEVNGVVLSPSFYNLITNKNGTGYTVLLNDYLIGAYTLRIRIVEADGITDFEGNPLIESAYEVPLTNNPVIPGPDDNQDSDSTQEDDDENHSNDALIKVVCPILMCFCAIVLLIGFFAPYTVYVWQAINFLQILSYMYLIHLEWPDTISDFLPGILYYNYFPNIFHLIDKDGPSPFDNAEDFDYDTSQFLRNNGVIITFFVAVGIVWPFIFLVSILLSGRSGIVSNTITKLKIYYNWNAYLRVYIETYLVAAVVCLLQLKYSEYDNANLIINFIAALIAIVIFT